MTLWITQVKPFTEFVMLPPGAVIAARDKQISKGALVTLGLIGQFVAGKQRPVTGYTRDWCAALGLEEKTFQNHMTELRSSGWLLFSRPHSGTWMIERIVMDPQEAAQLAAQGSATSEPPPKPKIFSDSPLEDVVVVQKREQQQNPKIFSGLPDELLTLLQPLAVQGRAWRLIAEAFAQTPERVLGWARYWNANGHGNGVKNPAGAFVEAVKGPSWPPAQYLTAATPPAVAPEALNPTLARAGELARNLRRN